jgi:hypothetical protein
MRASSQRTRSRPVPTDRLDLPDDTARLGTDGKHGTHFYSRSANTVVVVDSADRIARRQQLEDHSLTSWVTHVATEHGWRDLRHAESFVELLADSLETMIEMA